MAKAIKEKYEPPFGYSQSVINNLILLQRRGTEFGGLMKDSILFDVRRGHPTSVDIDIAIKKADADWHTHPSTPDNVPAIWPKKMAAKERQCSIEKELAWSETVSPNDVFIAMQYRPLNGNIPSLLVSEKKLLRYRLADDDKFDAFKNDVVAPFKRDVKEDDIFDMIEEKFMAIHNDEFNKAFDQEQAFTQCGEKEIYVNRKRRWFDFLESIGMKLEEKDIMFIPPKK